MRNYTETMRILEMLGQTAPYAEDKRVLELYPSCPTGCKLKGYKLVTEDGKTRCPKCGRGIIYR